MEPVYVISKGHEKYAGGQESIVHLVSSVEMLAQANRSCFFTDRHADLEYAQQFEDLALLPKKVDFSVMLEKYWASSQDIKEKRQAEFLVHHSCPWSIVQEIGVHNPTMMSKVQKILKEATHQPPVRVRSNWYY